MKRMKRPLTPGLLRGLNAALAMLLCLAFIAPVGAVEMADVQLVNVTPNSFALAWRMSSPADTRIEVYTDALGVQEITGDLTILGTPLHAGDPSLPSAYERFVDRRDLRAALEARDLAYLEVRGLSGSATYYYRAFAEDGAADAVWPGSGTAEVTTPNSSSFVEHPIQLVVTVAGEDVRGALVSVSADGIAAGAVGVVGDGAGADQAVLNLADFFGPGGGAPGSTTTLHLLVTSAWDLANSEDRELSIGGDFVVNETVAMGIAVVPAECDTGPCIVSGTPDGAGGCVYVYEGVDVVCDDGLATTRTDTCDGAGLCVGVPYTCPPEACEESSTPNGVDCDVVAASDGTACDDLDACTDADSCDQGACVGGDAVLCEAPDDCWVPGTCDPGTGLCSDPTAADDERCDDGNSCTRIACQGEDCEVHPFEDGTPCDDGDPCTGGETCRFAICWGGAAVDCDDGDACTEDFCDAATGCASRPLCCTEDGDCDDGDPTSAAWCDMGASECHYETISCDDEDGCTQDLLLPDGSCENIACNDGDPCTVDACNPFIGNGFCFFVPLACDDGDSCTADACDPGTGACVNQTLADGVLCDDADPCTESDQCLAGECAGSAVSCDDSDPCTLDACDAGTGDCAHVATACDGDLDGDGVADAEDCEPEDELVFPGADELCNNIDDDCDGDTDEEVLCCEVEADCDDSNPCTAHLCEDGTCSAPDFLDAVACDDGDACTTGESCVQGLCWGGAALLCEDGDPCTADACDPLQGCVFAPSCCLSDEACDDQDPRTADWCDLGTETCVYDPIDCDDGDGCTVDVLLADGSCVHEACDDGDPCTDDHCFPLIAEGVCYFLPKDCDDGNSCTLDSCDPASGACGNTALANGVLCDDDDLCSVDDVCAEGACVGVDVVCEDQDPCTAGTCDAATGQCSFPPAPCDGDIDGDGWPDAEDCEPADETAHPEAVERCNAMDDDCDGETDEQLLCCAADADCDQGNDCLNFACVDGACELSRRPDFADCEDGDACSDGDYCIYGFCWGGAPTDCDDGDICSFDACDPFSGCVHDVACCAEDGDCDDKLLTTVDWCDVDAGTCRYEAIGCDDEDGCTQDFLLADGSCEHRGCDDGDPCSVDVCNPFIGDSGHCYTYAKPCDDGEPCTVDGCDPGTGLCDHVARHNGADCDDGDLCSESDMCQGGICDGAPVDCDDGDPCTVDTCLPTLGVCDYGPGPCAGDEDGDGVADALDCEPADALVYPGAPERCNQADDDCDGATDEALACCDVDADCEDGNSCSLTSCLAGACARDYLADGTACDDGDPCTFAEACVFGTCWGGVAVDCDDADACTWDSCDSADGACVNDPVCDCPDRCVDGVCGDASLDAMTPVDLNTALGSKDFLLINVHVPFEGEIAGTDAHVPYTDIPGLLSVVGADQGQSVVVYCKTSAMALIAGQALVDQGYCAVRYLEGGMTAWEAAGYPLAE